MNNVYIYLLTVIFTEPVGKCKMLQPTPVKHSLSKIYKSYRKTDYTVLKSIFIQTIFSDPNVRKLSSVLKMHLEIASSLNI
jgi:hypothetical protein